MNDQKPEMVKRRVFCKTISGYKDEVDGVVNKILEDAEYINHSVMMKDDRVVFTLIYKGVKK